MADKNLLKKNALGKKHGVGYEIWRALTSNGLSVACMIFIALLILLSISGDWLFDYEGVVIKQNLSEALQAPSAAHWFGTDAYGRDYFARILYATRMSLVIALAAVTGSAILALLLGGIAAYYGGKVDNVIMRLLDIVLAVPQTLFIICIVVVLGNNTFYIILTLIVACTPGLTRTMRAAIMVNMQNEYVEAARSVGASGLRIMLTHLLPNSFGTLLVCATMSISGCILSTASLGYLGLGIPAPAPEWGRMLSEAQEYMRLKPYLIIIPGLFILLSSTAFNLFGDALRDAMDPRLRGFRRAKKKLFARRKA